MKTNHFTKASLGVLLALATTLMGCASSGPPPSPVAHPMQDFSLPADAEVANSPSAIPRARPVPSTGAWYPRDWDHYHR